jgi:hypothetical protein
MGPLAFLPIYKFIIKLIRDAAEMNNVPSLVAFKLGCTRMPCAMVCSRRVQRLHVPLCQWFLQKKN